MKDINCPYCGVELDINHDDGHGYAEDELHQQDCDSCGKTFVFTTYVMYHYTPQKADCLNGFAHDFKSTHTFPREFTRMECTMCGERRDPTAEEMNEILALKK